MPKPTHSSFLVHPKKEAVRQIKQAFAVLGQRGAGKSTLLQYLSKYQGVYTIPSSESLKHLLRLKLNREPTVQELIKEGMQLKKIHGHGVLVHLSLKQMFEKQNGKNIHTFIIDGLRTQAEVQAFQLLFKHNGHVIFIESPSEKKVWQRIKKRQKETGDARYHTFQEFQETQQLERDRIASLKELADINLTNNQSKAHFKKQIDQKIINPYFK